MSINVNVDTHYTFTIALEGVTQQLCLDVAQARTLKKLLNDIPALNLQQPKAPPIPQVPNPPVVITDAQKRLLEGYYEKVRKEAQEPWTGVLHPSFWRDTPWGPSLLVGGAASGPDSWAAKGTPPGGYEFT